MKRREPTEQEIRERAYELFLARGGVYGYDLVDWYKAEQELNNSPEEQAPTKSIPTVTDKAHKAIA